MSVHHEWHGIIAFQQPAESNPENKLRGGFIMFSTGKIALLMLGAATLSSVVESAELTPYSLPSERNRLKTQEISPQESANQAREEYYQSFKLKSHELSSDEKTRLLKTFASKQKDAEGRKNFDEAMHYLRLQSILKEGK